MTEYPPIRFGRVRSDQIVAGHFVEVPDDWPVGAEVTVTWTEPPEPTGRWVVVRTTKGIKPHWRDHNGTDWRIHEAIPTADAAEAALVDLIDTDHLPPPLAPVIDTVRWLRNNGYTKSGATLTQMQEIVSGTRDAIVALRENGTTDA